jgi:uncharacterized protein with FMN-binding domain
MTDFLDYGFAWIAVILALILAIVYVTRKAAQSSLQKNNIAANINRSLRKPHKTIGIFLIIAGLVHGLFSSETVWSLNLGTICWILSILLGVNWLLRKKLKSIGGWLFYHRAVTLMFIASIVWHVVDVGGIRVFDVISGNYGAQVQAQASQTYEVAGTTEQTTGSAESASSSASVADSSSAAASSSTATASDLQFDGVALADGTYTGSADGYGPNLTVSVTVAGGKVSSVEIVSHNEKNSRFYAAPMQLIPEEIISSQSLDVDIVSGATFTSKGIVNAVIDALSGAVTSGELPAQYDLSNIMRHH